MLHKSVHSSPSWLSDRKSELNLNVSDRSVFTVSKCPYVIFIHFWYFSKVIRTGGLGNWKQEKVIDFGRSSIFCASTMCTVCPT